MNLYLKFDAFDHPTQLGKVGNWIITFISAPEDQQHIQLAITSVIPRQACQDTEIRRFIIENTEHENIWKIMKIEAFNGKLNQEIRPDFTDQFTQQLISNILQEFQKYGVMIQCIGCD